MEEFIYLVKTNKSPDDVYLLGKSDLTKGELINQYSKKDWFYIIAPITDCEILYDKIYKIFLTKFILRPELGDSYFQGSKDKMITAIQEMTAKPCAEVKESVKSNIPEENKPTNFKTRQDRVNEVSLRLNEINIERTELTNEIDRRYAILNSKHRNYSQKLNEATIYQIETNKEIAELDIEKNKLELELKQS